MMAHRSLVLLRRYVIKTAFWAMLFAVLGLWALQLLFSYLAEIEKLTDDYTYIQALSYIGYRAPYFLAQFMPTGALLGAVVGLGILANNSELTVMRSVGVSIYRMVGWVLQPAVLFVLLALGLNQYVLPSSNFNAQQLRQPDSSGLTAVRGFWTLQTHDDGNQSVIHLDYADVSGQLGAVKLWQLDANNNLMSVVQAQSGQFMDYESTQNLYRWQLQAVETLQIPQDLTAANAAQAPALVQHSQPTAWFDLPLSPKHVYLLSRPAEDLSLTQLYAYDRYLRQQGQQSIEHQLAFWQKLLSPFSILSLVVVACSFVFGSLRTHSLGLRVVVALLFGLLFTYLQDLSGYVALATGWSPPLMVLLPILASLGLGMYLIYQKR